MLSQRLQARLAERDRAQRRRQRSTLSSAQGACIQVDGQNLINFCSNDYLGLANDPALAQAFVQGVQRYGVGSGASHLVCGHSHEHHALEEELADWTGRERALVFSTGYMANLGVVSALLESGDWVFEDRLNHASLLDAGLLSRARFKRFSHGDCRHLATLLARAQAGCKLVLTDGVFSMDGDVAPLAELAGQCQRSDAWLMVDDAHGLGCLGASGGGALEQAGLTAAQVPVLVGTFGKALGTSGAFVAGSELLIEALIQFARTYIYTTALPPAVAAATRSALARVRGGGDLRERLQARVTQFRRGCAAAGLALSDSQTAIQPLIVGSDERALALSQYLRAAGFWVSAIRPPTVPEGSARLRVTLSAAHSAAQVDALVAALARAPAWREAS